MRIKLLVAAWVVAQVARADEPNLQLEVQWAEAARLGVELSNQGEVPMKVFTRADAFTIRPGPMLRQRIFDMEEVMPPIVELEPGERLLIRLEPLNTPLVNGTLVYRASVRECRDCWHGALRDKFVVELTSLMMSLRAPRRAVIGAPVEVTLAFSNLRRDADVGAPCRDVVLTIDDVVSRPIVGFPCEDRPVFIRYRTPLTRTTTLTFDAPGEHVLRAFYDGLNSGGVAAPAVIVHVKPQLRQ